MPMDDHIRNTSLKIILSGNIFGEFFLMHYFGSKLPWMEWRTVKDKDPVGDCLFFLRIIERSALTGDR